jgi:AcrR family transcriptional regulator
VGRKKSQQNRSALILEVASELFAQFGYEKTTLDEIALRAGIGKGSVYLEFPNKEAILFALILENKRVQVTHMLNIAERTDKPALELLSMMLVRNVGMVFDSVQKNRRSPEEMAATRHRLRDLMTPFFEARLALVEGLLKRAEEQGEIVPQADLQHLSQLIVLALRGVFPPYERSAQCVNLQNQAAEILALIFTGLKAKDRKCL